MFDQKNKLKYMFNLQKCYNTMSEGPIGRRVNSIINSVNFLEDAQKVVNIMKPVSKALRSVDGDKKPTMDLWMKDVMTNAAYKSSKVYLKIINER